VKNLRNKIKNGKFKILTLSENEFEQTLVNEYLYERTYEENVFTKVMICLGIKEVASKWDEKSGQYICGKSLKMGDFRTLVE
jgi:hypothetical protein